MRLLIIIVLLYAGNLSAQRQKPPALHKVVYAIDTLFKKQAPLKTTLPSLSQRVAQAAAVCNSSCSALPVRFLSIKAERKTETAVRVQWETAAEANLRGYDVERSLGDLKHFEKAGFVTATGTETSVQAYTFPDGNNFSGTSYYRLRQLDKDGKFLFSKTVAVKGFSRQEGVEVFPNPAHDAAQANIWVKTGGKGTLDLFDANGRQLLQQKLTLSEGSQNIPVNTATLAPGLYFIRVVFPSQNVLSSSFIRQ